MASVFLAAALAINICGSVVACRLLEAVTITKGINLQKAILGDA